MQYTFIRKLTLFLLTVLVASLNACSSSDSIVQTDAQPGLQAMLEAELSRVLTEQGGKGIMDVTGVPVDPLTRTDVGNDTQLEWLYNNRGDYNQDGLVSIIDITLVAQFYNVGDQAQNWPAASVADGDGDTMVTIMDITTIAQNWQNLVLNYVVEADILGDGTWVPVANVPQTAGVEPAQGGLLEYSVTIPNGIYASNFRVSAGPEADPLIPIEVDPDAFLITAGADRTDGYTPLTVRFSVNFYQNETSAVTLDIDYDDGDTDSYGPGTDPQVFEHQFATAGAYHVVIVGQDGPGGKTSTRAVDITVADWTGETQLTNPSNWHEQKISEENENWGKHHAMALIGGMPAMVYTRDDRKEIYYAYATKALPTNATTDWVRGIVDDSDNLGGTLDLIECQGVPCVVYENTTDQDVIFAWADSATPAGKESWTSHEMEFAAISGGQLGVSNDMPAMVYITGGGINYAETNTVTGTMPTAVADWDSLEVDGDGFMDYAQLQFIQGFPVIAYQRADDGWQELRYAYDSRIGAPTKGSSELDNTWVKITVDAERKNSGNTVRMVLDSGLPVIAYQNVNIVSYLRLAYASSETPIGAGDWSTMTVRYQDQTHVGNWLGLAIFDGAPFMSYVDKGSGSTAGLHVSYATAAPPTGEADFDTGIIDPADGYFVNEETSCLILADGTLCITYRTSEGLKFAYYTAP